MSSAATEDGRGTTKKSVTTVHTQETAGGASIGNLSAMIGPTAYARWSGSTSRPSISAADVAHQRAIDAHMAAMEAHKAALETHKAAHEAAVTKQQAP